MIPVIPPNGGTYQVGSEILVTPVDSVLIKHKIMKVSE